MISIVVREHVCCSGCANTGTLTVSAVSEARVKLFGMMCAWPKAGWQLQPNLMMVCKFVFLLPPSAYSLRATPIKLHYSAAAVMGFREVLTKAGVSYKPWRLLPN